MELPPSKPGATGNFVSAQTASYVEQTCLPLLWKNQNEDGGWAFHVGHQSRVEPTAWAVIALGESAPSEESRRALDRGLRFLADTQLENGGWPAAFGDREGSWVTSLACWALQSRKENAERLARGLHWLSDDRPGDSGFWWRTMRKLTVSKRINAQNPSFSGWSWTPNTASWVEPTCYTMIVLSRESLGGTSSLRRRCELAEAMLYDRMCPGGGWNCGNPRIYGVAGQPQIGPTVWALVALRENFQRSENQQSLAWLERTQDAHRSPDSLVLSQIALGVYGRSSIAWTENLNKLNQFATLPWSIPTIAWTTLAFVGTSQWLNALAASV